MGSVARRRGQRARATAVGLAATALSCLLYLSGAYDYLDARLLDVSFRLRPPRPPDGRIAIVAVDDESLAAEPRKVPLPRGYLARLVRAAAAGEPAAILLDVLLDQPGASPSEDRDLAAALQDAGMVILPATATSDTAGDAARALPLPQFAGAAMAVGHVSLRESAADGVLRRFETAAWETKGGARLPSLPCLAAAALAESGAGQAGAVESAVNWPTNQFGTDVPLLDFAGPPGTYYPLPAREVLQEPAVATMLSGKLVIIGSTVTESHDVLRSPFASFGHGGDLMPGAEVLANCVGTLVGDRPLRLVPGSFVLAAMLALGAAATGLVAWLPGAAGIGLAVLLAAAAALLAPGLFSWAGVYWQAAGPALTALLAAAGGGADGYVRTLAQARALRQAFSRYLAPAVVDRLIAEGQAPNAGGHLQQVCVVFCDIQGFTAISRRLPPEDLVAMLSAFFEAVSRPVLDEGGFLDKFVGDQVMALFGVPHTHQDDAARAVRAVLGMRQAVPEFNARAAERGWPAVQISIGLHCGQAVVGNVGFSQRFDYTAMGDTVVLAQRLQSLCKECATDILLSRETVGAIGEEFVTRPVGTVQPKGWGEPVEVYTLSGRT